MQCNHCWFSSIETYLKWTYCTDLGALFIRKLPQRIALHGSEKGKFHYHTRQMPTSQYMGDKIYIKTVGDWHWYSENNDIKLWSNWAPAWGMLSLIFCRTAGDIPSLMMKFECRFNFQLVILFMISNYRNLHWLKLNKPLSNLLIYLKWHYNICTRYLMHGLMFCYTVI